MKDFVHKATAVLLSYLTWTLDMILTRSQSWRVWELNSNSVQMVFIGLWDAFYMQRFNTSEGTMAFEVHTKMNGSWVIPSEIWYGQDLMLLANAMNAAVLVFSSLALLVNWVNTKYPYFLRSYYTYSACFLCFSSLCTLGTVTWNFGMDFQGWSTLEFPPYFPFSTASVTKKHFTYVLPVGILTTIFSLVSATLFLEKYPWRQATQVVPAETESQ